MKIISLEASNVKRLRAVSITPTGAVIELTGKNRQGKTSILDAIWWLIAGANNIQSEPIRTGETEAVIVGVLGEDGSTKRLKVTRTFKLKRTELAKIEAGEDPDPTEYATTLTIENEDGFKAGKPQEMLDELIGSLAFDPLAFLHTDAKKRLVMLKELVGLDFTELDGQIKEAFTARTDVNRETESYKAQANAILIPADTPEEGVSVDDLIAELDAAGQRNVEIERAISARMTAGASVQRLRDQADEADEREKDLRAQAERILEQAEQAKAAAARLRETADQQAADLERSDQEKLEKIDTAELRRKIDEARATNDAVALRTRKADLQQKATDSQAKADALTATIDGAKAKKAEMLAASDMPVEGLDFGEDGVILRGQPFEQASDAEQLETSIAIAAAMNPKLRVIRVRDGSLMDTDAWASLVAFAEERDCQIWIETVQSDRTGAIVIEDGAIKDPGLLV